MTFDFDADAPFIVVNGSYSTGSGTVFVLRLLLDTGASSSVLKPTVLQGLIDLRARTGSFHRVETANGVVTAVEVRLPALFALGQMREEFVVSVFNFGSEAEFDGVIGLDFLHGRELRINFRRGEIELL